MQKFTPVQYLKIEDDKMITHFKNQRRRAARAKKGKP
tara:strand:+ start:290 stop:400 length:111 start_codon:yes stop_codon:yes gene_type:complete